MEFTSKTIVLAIVGVNRPNGAVHNEFISVRISDAKMGEVLNVWVRFHPTH